MSYYRDLREYLKALEDNGKLVRIKRPINKDTELQPLVRLQYRGLPASERKAFLFENVTDSKGRSYGIPVLICSLAANREMYAFGMGCDVDGIADRWVQVMDNPVEPVLVSRGPVQEEVHAGNSLLAHGGLDEFPIPISTPGYDAGPFITSPWWVSKEPDTGAPNLGTYRAQVKSPTRTGIIFNNAQKHLARHMAKREERGQPLEAAIILGGPPSLGYVSVSPVPYGTNDYAICGAIAGEPLELVKCKTVDLEVPARAEIVIEGIIPAGELEPEGPFGESLGYVSLRRDAALFNVTCITHCRNPVYQAFFSQFPPSESSVIKAAGRDGALYKHLRYDCQQPWVIAVANHEATGSAGLVVIKLARTEQPGVWKTLDEAAKWVAINLVSSKIVVAVDEDIDIRDADSINWATCFRMQPHRDLRIIEGPARSLLDPSVEPLDESSERTIDDKNMPKASRLLINATMKWPYVPVSLPKKEFMERALQIWQEEGLPSLQLKGPWWGQDLGYWPKEENEDAMLAVRGDYKVVGDKLGRARKTKHPHQTG